MGGYIEVVANCPNCGLRVKLPCLKCQIEQKVPQSQIVYPKPDPPTFFKGSDPKYSKFATQSIGRRGQVASTVEKE